MQKTFAWLQCQFCTRICMRKHVFSSFLINEPRKSILVFCINSTSPWRMFLLPEVCLQLLCRRTQSASEFGFLHELVHLKIKFSTYFGSFLFYETRKIITDIVFLLNFTIHFFEWHQYLESSYAEEVSMASRSIFAPVHARENRFSANF